jgi:hypothetical protein
MRSGLLLAVGLSFAAGGAQASTVVLVRSLHPTAQTEEATVRLKGELVSAGFPVRIIDPVPASSSDTGMRATLEKTAAEPDVLAAVAILGGPGLDDQWAEIWVVDRLTEKTVVRRVPSQLGSPRGAEILAIRALELLRASFMEPTAEAQQTKAQHTTDVSPPVEVVRSTHDAPRSAADDRSFRTWGVEMGACVLLSFEGVGPAVLPIIRGQRTFPAGIRGRISLAGLGTRAHVSNALASGEISHQFALVEGARFFRTSRRVQPFVSVGLGALRVAASGETPAQSSDLYSGADGTRWSFLADVGAGVHLSFRGRFEASMELHAQLADPYPEIRILQNGVAREGRPTMMASLALAAWM